MPENWLWLFPLTYVVHIAEEGFAGERFYRWIRRMPVVSRLGVEIGARLFFSLNAVFLVVMTVAVFASRQAGFGWVVPALGALVAVNGLGHLAGSVLTRSYSPGLISGLFLWLPLGLFALATASATLEPAVFWAGIGAGVIAQAAVPVIAVLAGRSRGA